MDGETVRGLAVPLDRIASQLDTLTSKYRADPIRHSVDAGRSEQTPAVGIAVIDGSLTLLEDGVSAGNRSSKTITSRARTSVGRYLDPVAGTSVGPADKTPPTPDLDALHTARIPTVAVEKFEATVAERDDRRREQDGLVKSDERRRPNGADD